MATLICTGVFIPSKSALAFCFVFAFASCGYTLSHTPMFLSNSMPQGLWKGEKEKNGDPLKSCMVQYVVNVTLHWV